MVNLYELPEDARQGLRGRNVHLDADRIVRLIVTALAEAAELVVQDLGPERNDDSVSEGVARWRRARNILEKWLRDADPALADVRIIDADNAFHLAHGDVVVCFYSARNGVDRPDLAGGSKTKRAVVDQMQQQLDGLTGGPEITRLALLYDADGRGLREIAVGLLETVKAWDWNVVVFRRDRDELPRDLTIDQRPRQPPRPPAYDEQPEPEIPPLEPQPEERARDERANEEGAD